MNGREKLVFMPMLVGMCGNAAVDGDCQECSKNVITNIRRRRCELISDIYACNSDTPGYGNMQQALQSLNGSRKTSRVREENGGMRPTATLASGDDLNKHFTKNAIREPWSSEGGFFHSICLVYK